MVYQVNVKSMKDGNKRGCEVAREIKLINMGLFA